MAILTNRDYLAKSLAKFNITENDVDVILAENPNINGSSAVNVADCKIAIHKSLSTILPMANISESGMSISWNMEALKLWYNALCRELGKTSALKPAIRDRSNYH